MGLTDEQIDAIGAERSPYTDFQFARAIESAATSPLLEKIAELEQRNRDLYEDVQRFKEHAMNEKAARMALEQELETVRKDAGWRPIETAPPFPFVQKEWYKNGPRLLLGEGSWVYVGSYGYTERGKGRWQDYHGRNCQPTHWMPLPPPPGAALERHNTDAQGR